MLLKMKLLFVIFLALWCHVSCFEFEDAKQDGVEFGSQTTLTQTITVDENNDGGRATIVLITGVGGTITMTLLADNATVLEATIDDGADPSQKSISVDRIDYEYLKAQGMETMYQIDVIEDNDSSKRKTLNIYIRNLDDESPTLSTTNCIIPENTDVTVDTTECTFQVSDPDGFLSTMDFTAIVGTRNEINIFELKYKTQPADDSQDEEVKLVLKDGVQLDYEAVTLYTFRIEAKDAAGHSTTPLASVPIIVQVEDLPDEPPLWDSFTSAKTIPEKTATTIQVSAKDGDYGINSNITYSCEDTSGFITIDADTGLISVAPINRDDNHDQVVFSVTATEVEEPHDKITGTVTLIVEDIDDCIPEISVTGSDVKEININIDERSSEINAEIVVNDADLGANAMYDAALVSIGDVDFLSAFQIVPGKGYQQTTLTLTITDPLKLDFETPEWINITMELHTTGTSNPENKDVLPITITLNDINDESPIFDSDEYKVEIYENATMGTVVTNIRATDKDAEDAILSHEILGTLAKSILTIPAEGGGEVTTLKDDAFDFEKQEEVYVQIRATDKVGHTANTQLTITVLDINDENPRLVVSSTIDVMENQVNGYELETNIVASDEDTTADLKFEIDWDKSYASKNSRRLEPDVFKNYQCIEVETVPGDDNHQVSAKLTIKETQEGNTPDYEKYDNLYIQLNVTDLNTEKNEGTDSALIVITIQDDNDNAPVFADDSGISRTVMDGADSGSITTVVATDADVDNDVEYSIESADDNTPDWVEIDKASGNIVVKTGVKIDCDDPKRDNLVYNVTATDGKHDTVATITITILDINDNAPTLGNQQYTINEDSSIDPDVTQDGKLLITLEPADMDRDEAFHTVQCLVASSTTSDVTTRFQVKDNTILVALSAGSTLDYETSTQYDFTLNCIDDPTHQGSVSLPVNPAPTVTIFLEDVNDNYPRVATTSITGITENTAKGPISTKLQGEDLDSGDNGLMEFSIKKIQRFLDAEHQNEQDIDQGVFTIETADNNMEATLSLTTDNLSGNYGYLQLTITTTDLGDPPLSQDTVVDLEVSKYNFKEPIFEFPKDSDIIYLKSAQDANTVLKVWNDVNLQNLQVNDQQDNKYSFTMDVIEDSSGLNLFKVYRVSNTQGQLQLATNVFDRNPFKLTVQATISSDTVPSFGEAAYSVNCTINVDFFDQDSTDPVFSHNTGSTEFPENSESETYQLENATYPDIAIPGLGVYYLLTAGDTSKFHLDSTSGLVTLLQPLDYEEQTSYELTIQSSNSLLVNPNAVDATKFQLTINVKDVNDETPVFEKDLYYGTLLTTTDSASALAVTEVLAIDKDSTSQNQLTYWIESSTGSTEDLNNLLNPFEIGKTTGQISLNFDVKDSMSGYFTLDVYVLDEAPENHKASTTVKIYLVTSQNTVNFRFQNERNMVDNAEDIIKDILDAEFGYETNIEAAKSGDTNTTTETLLPVFFLDLGTNEPVDGTVILKRVTNVETFTSLQQEFAKYSLNLMSFDTTSTDTQNLENILRGWLIGVAVVLGSLCLILLIAFILKTRALNQRINKLSNTKFGSQESGLNRTGVAAPTTNKHAIEGSNPVYNNEVDAKDLERVSVTSGDSDLIGVEDDNKFDYNYPNKNEVFE